MNENPIPIPESENNMHEAAKFDRVFASELAEISLRQGRVNEQKKEPAIPAADPKELAGLALSGGGIRAATSALGVLQALRRIGILPVFDYLSTVSGGGFAGSWWSAWTSRDFDATATKEERFFPPIERTQPERDAQDRDAKDILNDDGAKEGSTTVDGKTGPDKDTVRKRRLATDPAHHLRLFSNYLTPVKGLMSGDTWRAVTIISRNLGLTWLVTIPILFAVVLAAQAYFTLQPESETEFLYPYSHFREDEILNDKLRREITAAKNLDHLVHHTDSARNDPLTMLRIRSLPKIALIEQSIAIDKETDSIDRDEQEDSIISSEIGEKTTYAILRSDIDSVDYHARQLHVMDSLRLVDSSYSAAVTDSARQSLRHRLDKDVDSMRMKLATLHDALIEHRWQVRDGWLFNATHMGYLTDRLLTASYIPIALLAWVVMFISLWMTNVSNAPRGGNIMQGSFAYVVGLVSFWTMLWGFPHLLGREITLSWNTLALISVAWAAIALVLLNRVMWDEAHRFWKIHRPTLLSPSSDSIRIQQELSRLLEVRRTRIVLSHERLLLITFFVTVWLLFGGFGHEVINYLFNYTPSRASANGGMWQWLIRVVSASALFSAIAGSAFVAKTAAPVSGGDRKQAPTPSKFKSLLMSVAPPLILVILVCGVSWASHWILQDVVFRAEDHANRNLITIVVLTWLFALAAMYYVIEEFRFGKRSNMIRRMLLTLQVGFGIVTLSILHNIQYLSGFRWLAIGITVLSWLTILWQGRRDKKSSSETSNPEKGAKATATIKPAPPERRGIRRFGTIAGTTIVILIFSQAMLITAGILLSEATMPFHWPYLTGLLVCFGVLICEFIWGESGNHEARILLGAVIAMCTLFLFIPPLAEDPHLGITHVLATLVSVALGLVVYIGWRLDPNALSIHAFYRSRIVRAYLGASNWMRGISSVSEVHPNDDMALSALNNCESSAPYHLINTTLNLLGTKSLEAAQRHASNFIMSKRYCGSVTTGYRPTEDYMSGEMTLGTAVAISGAAASPNMGSASKSGAITMLMSLLNIRLGYWAPNPMGRRWRDSQPKFWPYYLIKESLSQTTGLGAFCYLTDGGHFDNTGLYPLIERACRYIVICDNGADPLTHFTDVGNAFRRCRIDFGAEFALEGLREMTGFAAPAGSTRQHWLRGTVTYSREHLRTLWGNDWDKGMSDVEREAYRTGTILILKPVVLGDEPADVLQYGLQHSDFPQQSTANQWFTENQFESYRRLGYWTAQSAFNQQTFEGRSRAELLYAIRDCPAEPPLPK